MRTSLVLLTPLFAACASTGRQAPSPGLSFDVVLSSTIADAPVSGRVFVLIERAKGERPGRLAFSFLDAQARWIAATPVDALAPGGRVTVDPDRLVFPAPFTRSSTGTYRLMAVIDRDGSFVYAGADGGDLASAVVERALDPAAPGTIELLVNRTVPVELPPVSERVVTFEVPTRFTRELHSRPAAVPVTVALPRAAAGGERWPVVYVFSGYGGGPRGARWWANQYDEAMQKKIIPEMIYVILEGSCPTGHHAFTDSANNGPWGRVLFEELIPEVERRFPVRAERAARFLTGHSSGGWASLWAMISRPELFAGVWATAPDSVDFRDFTGVDLTRDDNIFVTPDGRPRNLFRAGGQDRMSFRDFATLEAVLGGGPLDTFDWVHSPRGADGKPRWVWDRATGRIDHEVARTWQPFDIVHILETRWSELGPKLQGRLHVAVGAEDNFHLEGAVRRLCALLEAKQAGGTCEVVPGDHGFRGRPTQEKSYAVRIAHEMQRMFSSPSSAE